MRFNPGHSTPTLKLRPGQASLCLPRPRHFWSDLASGNVIAMVGVLQLVFSARPHSLSYRVYSQCHDSLVTQLAFCKVRLCYVPCFCHMLAFSIRLFNASFPRLHHKNHCSQLGKGFTCGCPFALVSKAFQLPGEPKHGPQPWKRSAERQTHSIPKLRWLPVSTYPIWKNHEKHVTWIVVKHIAICGSKIIFKWFSMSTKSYFFRDLAPKSLGYVFLRNKGS